MRRPCARSTARDSRPAAATTALRASGPSTTRVTSAPTWSIPTATTSRPSGIRDEMLSAEQREIRELIRTLARERIAPRAAEIDESADFPWDMVELLKEHDIFGLPFEERYGGSGTGALMVLVAVEEVSRACATTGLIL